MLSDKVPLLSVTILSYSFQNIPIHNGIREMIESLSTEVKLRFFNILSYSFQIHLWSSIFNRTLDPGIVPIRE